MAGVSAEVLLISALINNQLVGEEVLYGISEADFLGYRDHYVWAVTYVDTYNAQPSVAIFKTKWPDFPLVEHHDIRSAAQMVHEAGNRRLLNTVITEATDLLRLGDVEAAHSLMTTAQYKQALARPKAVLTDSSHLEEWRGKPYTIEVPYPSLQRYTGGIRAGNLWYIAGRPSQGKSAHLSAIAKKAVCTGNRALFYSLEMSEEEVRARFHSAWAQDLGYPSISLTSLRDRRVDLDTYRNFYGELGERLEACGGWLDIHTPADGPVSPSVVAARAGEYDLVIVDYVGLMAQDGGGHAIDDWRVMAQISNRLKEIALSQQTAIVGAAQINRDGETGSAPPKVKNLAQSDALGQDADVVLTMRSKPHSVATHFSLEKNRHGTSGIYFFTTFDPDHGVYTEISADHAEDLVINAEALADAPTPPQLRVIKKDEL